MRKELKRALIQNSAALESSNGDFEALYEIMFQNEKVLAEYTDGFRVHKLTFSDVKQKIESAASALHKKIGATHGYVALEMENCVDWIVAFWAILKSGNKPYLVNCRHPKALTEKNFQTLNIQHIVGKEKSNLSGNFMDITTLSSEAEDKVYGEFENEIALSTSATSLKDVICFYSGKELRAQILNVKDFIHKHPEIAMDCDGVIKNLAFLPFYHIFGLIAVYFWFSFYGCTIVFLKDYSADTILKTCRKHKVTHVFAVPLLWHTIENSVMKKVSEKGEKKEKKLAKGLKLCTKLQNLFPRFGMRLSQSIMHEVTDELFGKSVRFCINGGSYIRQSALELMNGIGYNLHNGYGMSEIGITSVELRNKPKYKNLNSIGVPFKSVEYKINEKGILQVKGTSVCNRLLIEGKEVPLTEWFDTGDKMECRDGAFYIVGRLGDVIIGENGENINPDTIEQRFVLPEAENFSVIGLKNGDKEQVCMVVQIGAFMSDAKREALTKKMYAQNDALPLTTSVQKFYYTQDAIAPPNAVKVGRKYLLQGIQNGDITLCSVDTFQKGETKAEYSDKLLETVTAVVAKHLNVSTEEIDVHAHLMLDMGATSMQYFSVLAELGEKFSLKSEESEALRDTVHEMCQYIERRL